ncbi:unnamed protein product, partial [Symbiodinium necroappetens]
LRAAQAPAELLAAIKALDEDAVRALLIEAVLTPPDASIAEGFLAESEERRTRAERDGALLEFGFPDLDRRAFFQASVAVASFLTDQYRMHEGSDFKLKVIKAANSVLVTFRSAEYAQAVRETTIDLAKQLDAGSTSAQALLRAELRSSHGPAFSAEADELLSSLRQDAEALREKPLRAVRGSSPERRRSCSRRAAEHEDGAEPSFSGFDGGCSDRCKGGVATDSRQIQQAEVYRVEHRQWEPAAKEKEVAKFHQDAQDYGVRDALGFEVLVLPRGAAFELQRDTARAKTFRDDLRTFARNFRIQAELVGLDKASSTKTREKRLQNLLNYHFPLGAQASNSAWLSLVLPRREVRLRVAESPPRSGAGIDLTPSDRGFQVDHVEEFPGQDFSAGEVILAINGHKLSGLSEDEEETFGAHFGDGASPRPWKHRVDTRMSHLRVPLPPPAGIFRDPGWRMPACTAEALGMAAIMENQVEEMRKLLSRFKVCANPAAAGIGADVDAGALPGHADILIFGPSGSGKSSLIRTFYMALHKTQQVPADFADRIIVKDTAMNEGTLKYISAVIKPAKLDHRGNILSSSILCHDTRGQIWMDEREQKQLSVIMDGNVKDDSMVQQRNYRYARLLWEFWKRDSELFPPEILANKRGVHNQPHAVLFVFDGSMEEIPDGEEETKFYREIIQMCREKGYTNPQASKYQRWTPLVLRYVSSCSFA